MTLQIQVDARGIANSRDALELVGRRAGHMQPIWPTVADVFAESTRRRFQREGEGDWKPLSDATEHRHPDARLMRASNALYRSVTERRARYAVRDYSEGSEMRFGTSLFYAKFHDAGEGVPQREIFDVDRATLHRVAAVIGRYLATGQDTRT